MAWLLYVKARNVRQLLERVRAEHIANYRTRLKVRASICYYFSHYLPSSPPPSLLFLSVTWK